MATKLPIPFLLALVTSLSVWAGEEGAKPEQVQVDVHTRAEWLVLPAPADSCPGRVKAMSALRILRAVDPVTHKAYDESNDALGCDPENLRRAFLLEKTEFLLGEPILIEFRIELDGPGEWTEPIGGNNRARGRDDNFLFLMRQEDGTWVGDPYAPIMHSFGGLGSAFGATQGEPGSYWLAVQRWCAIKRPGTYDLFCFQWAHDWRPIGRRAAVAAALPDELRGECVLDADGRFVDAATGQPSERYRLSMRGVRVGGQGAKMWSRTPFYDGLPVGALKQVPKLWNAKQTADFAHFRIVITPATAAERRAMIEHWTQVASSPREGRWYWLNKAVAARQAIQFAQQDDFLPLIAEWIRFDRDTDGNNFTGLAMRPSAEATALLLKSDPRAARNGMYYLRDEKVADVIPHLIDWLVHEHVEVRRQAEWYLRKWTGQAFGHTWEGTDRQRPTLEEGKAMQPAWREWWATNKAGFVPVER